MASLQIRDLPEPLYRKLLDEAKRQHRSLSQQAVAVLEKGLGISEEWRSRRRKVLAKIVESGSISHAESLPEAVTLIKEDRAR